eukprot:TRINITY_DN14075_c1_g1_i1.p1 TRINITY_DN14075_c1_g1~~TRINITY_DN14075_c1_g1_i1.p1  ORF type:complete len:1030 (+),score=252.41 TRINITY_DN14075_c1_g1_i1:123-3212(+)
MSVAAGAAAADATGRRLRGLDVNAKGGAEEPLSPLIAVKKNGTRSNSGSSNSEDLFERLLEDDSTRGAFMKGLINVADLNGAWVGLVGRLCGCEQALRSLEALSSRSVLERDFVMSSEYQRTVVGEHGDKLSSFEERVSHLEEHSGELDAGQKKLGEDFTWLSERIDSLEALFRAATAREEANQAQANERHAALLGMAGDLKAQGEEREAAATRRFDAADQRQTAEEAARQALDARVSDQADFLASKRFEEHILAGCNVVLQDYVSRSSLDTFVNEATADLLAPVRAELKRLHSQHGDSCQKINVRHEGVVSSVSDINRELKHHMNVHAQLWDAMSQRETIQVASTREEKVDVHMGKLKTEMEQLCTASGAKLKEIVQRLTEFQEILEDHEHTLQHQAEELLNRATKYDLIVNEQRLDQCAIKERVDHDISDIQGMIRWMTVKLEDVTYNQNFGGGGSSVAGSRHLGTSASQVSIAQSIVSGRDTRLERSETVDTDDGDDLDDMRSQVSKSSMTSSVSRMASRETRITQKVRDLEAAIQSKEQGESRKSLAASSPVPSERSEKMGTSRASAKARAKPGSTNQGKLHISIGNSSQRESSVSSNGGAPKKVDKKADRRKQGAGSRAGDFESGDLNDASRGSSPKRQMSEEKEPAAPEQSLDALNQALEQARGELERTQVQLEKQKKAVAAPSAIAMPTMGSTEVLHHIQTQLGCLAECVICVSWTVFHFHHKAFDRTAQKKAEADVMHHLTNVVDWIRGGSTSASWDATKLTTMALQCMRPEQYAPPEPPSRKMRKSAAKYKTWTGEDDAEHEEDASAPAKHDSATSGDESSVAVRRNMRRLRSAPTDVLDDAAANLAAEVDAANGAGAEDAVASGAPVPPLELQGVGGGSFTATGVGDGTPSRRMRSASGRHSKEKPSLSRKTLPAHMDLSLQKQREGTPQFVLQGRLTSPNLEDKASAREGEGLEIVAGGSMSARSTLKTRTSNTEQSIAATKSAPASKGSQSSARHPDSARKSAGSPGLPSIGTKPAG